MKKRIFSSIFFCTSVALLLCCTLVTAALYQGFVSDQVRTMESEASFIAEGYHSSNGEALQSIAGLTTNRITLIRFDGQVLFDSAADTAVMENHLFRPEVESALVSGKGHAERFSGTLGETTFYYAQRLGDGNVLRLAVTRKTVLSLLGPSVAVLLLAVAITVAMTGFAASKLTQEIIRPINALDLAVPLENQTYDELSPLLLKIERQNEKIRDQLARLSQSKDEFEYITQRMNQSLLIFSDAKRLIFANESACRLFDYDGDSGVNYIEICRSRGYVKALERAFLGESATERFEKNKKIYEVVASGVPKGAQFAAVALITDVTGRELLETMRREFSANVSHELKTPLTSILGYAELLKENMVKPADFGDFGGRIYSEARRLLALIDDIIKLPRLDEGGVSFEYVDVDLHAVLQTIFEQLKEKAAAKRIALKLEGDAAVIFGVASVLHEMLFNLCDNAIIYNNEGGSVTASVKHEMGGVMVCVQDNGIGIAPEHIERIFERFYRVDASRDKRSGGTGLGLSIVKHAAKMHEAVLNVVSKPNEGTTISVWFAEKKPLV